MLDVNDLNVGSVLVWGQSYHQDRTSFTGEDHPLSLPDHILHYDLEVSQFAADHTGHLNILGLSDIDFSDDPFLNPFNIPDSIDLTVWADRVRINRAMVFGGGALLRTSVASH